jgi:hypothetical protein
MISASKRSRHTVLCLRPRGHWYRKLFLHVIFVIAVTTVNLSVVDERQRIATLIHILFIFMLKFTYKLYFS